MPATWVQDFSDGDATRKDLLGGKGANLAEMTRMGIPVPPGFTVTTEACNAYLADGALPEGLVGQLDAAVDRLESRSGRRFGDPSDPLLVSVRSGARFSMPGMMDTVLDLGLNPVTVKGLAEAADDERFAYDSWRRFTEMYGRIVLGVPGEMLGEVAGPHLRRHEIDDPALLPADAAQRLALDYRHAIESWSGTAFPDDPREQLIAAVEAVFRSWNGRRARNYRRLEGIPDDLGTAVNVQTMVFGNLGEESGTGVVFTRDPATGAPGPYGDFLLSAQGEDVVAGVRNTEPFAALADHFPDVHAQLVEVLELLETRFREMCDVEFTVERGRLWVLQTRVGKRSAPAALRIAVDMADEGLISEEDAVRRFQPEQLERLLHPSFDPAASRTTLTNGLGASPGAASGRVRFTADEAEQHAENGEAVILVRPETSPEDLHGLVAARGVLTSRGGLVSHAAVVARGIGKPAVCGADEIQIDVESRRFVVGETEVQEGDVVSIDGTSGEVVLGEVPVLTPEPTPELQRLLGWADRFRRLGVRANADTPDDAARARAFGAEGIGLCRTEHMFLGDRLPVIRHAILATESDERRAALQQLHDLQREDFEAVLAEMDGLPVTVRLLDPPLHEFLPDVEELRIREVRGELDGAGEALLVAAERWREHNPMLGIRGVRLSFLEPEIYRMQVRALVEAALSRQAAGGMPMVQIMLPLTVSEAELEAAVVDVLETVEAALDGDQLEVHVGTMIETPRAALRSAAFAAHVEFCSFGTNDLTQLTFGFSRDDIEARLMPTYLERGLLDADPFATIDVDGVGRLVAEGVAAGLEADPEIEFGVCGEHGGDPDSVRFFHTIALDYVSCSPFRVPLARLAAAHAALEGAG
ncbi:MAG: pyruvate, phosphate dikinase [Nitriliruptorales bacterium]|nr:pyruvate, phosphate dikinase [Nitriliruptorales bacterium]